MLLITSQFLNYQAQIFLKFFPKDVPFDFSSDDFGDNKVVQTILNHVDVTIHRRSENDVDLYVRRSFAGYLWDWLKDSAKLI